MRTAASDQSQLPRIFFVNWFRKNEQGKFVWPGFGDNVRVLKWIVDRIDGKVEARDTAIGRLPIEADLDMSGITVPAADMATLLTVDSETWKREAKGNSDYLSSLGDVPKALWRQQEELEDRLAVAG